MSIFDNEHNSAIQEAIVGNQDSALQGALITATEVDMPTDIAFDDGVINYYFDIITDESIELINQITDNWVENNTAIQDHIAQNPLVITISGISGEKVFRYDPAVANQLLAEARLQAAKMGHLKSNAFWTLIGADAKTEGLNKLTDLSVLYPPASNYMQVAMNAAKQIDASVTKYSNIYNSLKNKPENTNLDFFGKFRDQNEIRKDELGNEILPRLHQIYNKLSQLRAANRALTVTTAYGTFTDMYIQSLTLKQGNQLYVTDIEMTLKQLRFSNVTTTAADKNVIAQYNAYARAKVENNGTTQGINEDVSVIYKSIPGEPNVIRWKTKKGGK